MCYEEKDDHGLESKVLDIKALGAQFEERSRRSLYRDLGALGYLTSYTHGGRYHTRVSAFCTTPTHTTFTQSFAAFLNLEICRITF